MPRFVYISKTDEENSDYNATFDALRERFGNKIAPIVVPIWDDDKKVTGIIDVLNKRAFEMQPNGKRVEIERARGQESVRGHRVQRRSEGSPWPRPARSLWTNSSPARTSPMPR